MKKKRKTKPQAKRACLQCGSPLSGYKLKYCDGVCQRKAAWRREKAKGQVVSECCEAEVSTTVRGNFCKSCGEKTRLATIYAIPTDHIRQELREQKRRIVEGKNK